MQPDGNAIVYCEGAFDTLNGKTAHGLVRFCRRYHLAAVVDSRHAGRDAGDVLDGRRLGIPVVASLREAVDRAARAGTPATHLVVGIAPDGGRLAENVRRGVVEAVELRLNVDCGLHDFLGEDEDIRRRARRCGVVLRDIRKPPARDRLHFFSGKIDSVEALKIAVLGTDSAVGKRTTAWLLVEALERSGHKAEMVGTGQTAWLQGARYAIVIDALVNDFVAGEIEHAVWSAWNERHPEAIVIEGQGSLMNPAYPGGLEILAAGRPDLVVLQHAPARKNYDGFPKNPIHPLSRQIQAIETLSDVQVAAVTLNREGIDEARISVICEAIQNTIGRPVFDVLRDRGQALAAALAVHLKKRHDPL